jgi:hypothetical protein
MPMYGNAIIRPCQITGECCYEAHEPNIKMLCQYLEFNFDCTINPSHSRIFDGYWSQVRRRPSKQDSNRRA